MGAAEPPETPVLEGEVLVHTKLCDDTHGHSVLFADPGQYATHTRLRRCSGHCAHVVLDQLYPRRTLGNAFFHKTLHVIRLQNTPSLIKIVNTTCSYVTKAKL